MAKASKRNDVMLERMKRSKMIKNKKVMIESENHEIRAKDKE